MQAVNVQLPLGHLELPPGEKVHLWLSRVSDWPLPMAESQLIDSPSPAPGEEVSRGAFRKAVVGEDRKNRVARERFRRRFLLRLLLGAYLDCPGKDVRMIKSPRGKPALAPELSASGLRFSISHSGDWLVVAVGREVALGVDLEVPRTMNKVVDMARRYFSDHESELIEHSEAPFRDRTFLRVWTAKEAMVKAAGTGLAGYIGQVRVAPGGSPCLLGVPDGWPAPECWSLLELELPEGLLGHLAVMRPGVSCVLHRFESVNSE